jgi:hypothetical protein
MPAGSSLSETNQVPTASSDPAHTPEVEHVARDCP